MIPEVALYDWLVSDPVLVAVVEDRVYPMMLPQDGAIPAIVYQRIMTYRVVTHSGDTALVAPRFQLSLWADTPNAAWDLAEKVIDRIDGYSGMMAGLKVGSARVINELQDAEEADNMTRFRVILDVPINAIAN